MNEQENGTHYYTVQIQMPKDDSTTCLKKEATAQVRITGENELRVLFVQGKLTWDFKFITRALAEDPSVKVTGLSRTSTKSVFRQNVLNPGELTSGFPTTMAEIAPFRLVVISSLNPSGLTPDQQELVARFCSELGGGVLLLGGPDTFDSSWQGSKLEQLLPVTFDSDSGLAGLDRPFHMQITDEALQTPAFQIADPQTNRAAWAQLPAFSEYGRVASAKPGAVVWARHEEDSNSAGKRILMASQRYGAGLSAVICIDNFWRWRLAKDANIQQFDRFWQQLFRYLGQAGRQDVTLSFTDEELKLNSDVHMIVERQPGADTAGQPASAAASAEYRVVVHDPGGQAVFDQKCELVPSRPVDLSFHPEKEGVYIAGVMDSAGTELATRSIDLRTGRVELEKTARDMENLRQWANLSGGAALRLEDCADGGAIMKAIKSSHRKIRRATQDDRPRRVESVGADCALAKFGNRVDTEKEMGIAMKILNFFFFFLKKKKKKKKTKKKNKKKTRMACCLPPPILRPPSSNPPCWPSHRPPVLAGFVFDDTSTFFVGRLKFSNNDGTDCGDVGRDLVNLVSQASTIKVNGEKLMQLSDPGLFETPFLFMNGHNDFVLSDAELENLRVYFAHGGFLLASGCCTNPGFPNAWRREFSRIFPEAKR